MGKYLSFRGTSSRSKYWGVTVLSFIAFTVTIFIAMAMFAAGEVTGIIVGSLIALASIVLYTWLFLAVAIKRCREAGINPWWTAACVLPYIGFVVWIVIGCLPPEQKELV